MYEHRTVLEVEEATVLFKAEDAGGLPPVLPEAFSNAALLDNPINDGVRRAYTSGGVINRCREAAGESPTKERLEVYTMIGLLIISRMPHDTTSAANTHTGQLPGIHPSRLLELKSGYVEDSSHPQPA